MKRLIVCVALMTLVTLLSLQVNVLAEDISYSSIHSMNEEFVFPDGKTADEIIAETYSQSYIDSLLENAGQVIPDKYWIDTSIFVLEYSASNQFLIGLNNVTENGISDTMFSEYPLIYIPIFGLCSDTTRIIGHVKIYYNYLEECYTASPVLKYATSDLFISGQVKHFLEEIDAFHGYKCVLEDIGLSRVATPILVRLSTAYNDSSEKVLLVVDEENVYVYDFMNSVHAAQTEQVVVMTATEYAARRAEFEQKVVSNNAGHGGISTNNETVQGSIKGNAASARWKWFLIAVAVLGVVPCVAIGIRSKK